MPAIIKTIIRLLNYVYVFCPSKNIKSFQLKAKYSSDELKNEYILYTLVETVVRYEFTS